LSVLSAALRALLGAAERGAVREGAETAAKQAVRAGERMAVKRAEPLAVKGRAWWDQPAQAALPPPPRRLALPKPPPGGTRVANVGPKPRGGNWYPDKLISEGQTYPRSPEELARQALPTGVTFSSDPRDIALRDWWHRALPKYIKNDFGTEADPLLDLAGRGLHPDAEMTPGVWRAAGNATLDEDSIGSILFPPNELGGMPGAGDSLRGEFVVAMPWLPKQPVTDSIYGIDPNAGEYLGLSHVADELRNAMVPDVHGFPPDLAVRPESLGRMSFPQAAEHVGRINQWRAKQMELQQAELAANPAVHLVKEYPDSPQGMRWVELKHPGVSDTLPEGYTTRQFNYLGDDLLMVHDPHGNPLGDYVDELNAAQGASNAVGLGHLRDALRYEGDQMGHCVGGYCDDVASGRSRIFSLRDAKGAPHVTIETSPGSPYTALTPAQRQDFITQAQQGLRPGASHDSIMQSANDLMREWASQNAPHDIVQIKGKQNRAPIEDYLPFVQDFVKTQGPWGHVGDLHNTQLVGLPDGRFITRQQFNDIRQSERLDDVYQSYDFDAYGFPEDPREMAPEDWRYFDRYFRGYAYGGRVEAHRDFARNPLAVR